MTSDSHESGEQSLSQSLSEIEGLVGSPETWGLGENDSDNPCSISSLTSLERRINESHIFSKNEQVDDLNVLGLRCLSVSYYVALAYDSQRPGKTSLLDKKKMAMVYYDAFLERCLAYEAFEPRIKKMAEACAEEGAVDEDGIQTRHVEVAQTTREEKIEMFKVEQQLKRDMEALEKRMSDVNTDDEKEEMMRPQVLMKLNHHGLQAIRSLRMVRQEVAMLEAAESMPASDREAHDKRMADSQKETRMFMEKLRDAARGLSVQSKREAVRADVFKPSHILPTFSVEEFGEMEIARMRKEQNDALKISAEKKSVENEIEDDEENLAKMRAWDDFRDENPKGWGNSKSRPTG